MAALQRLNKCMWLSSAPIMLQIVKTLAICRIWHQYAYTSISWEEIPHLIWRNHCFRFCSSNRAFSTATSFFHGICDRQALQATSNLSHGFSNIKQRYGPNPDSVFNKIFSPLIIYGNTVLCFTLHPY